MSSVSGSGGSSGSNSSDEAVRKLREDYRKKEAALIKKHQQELKAIDQKYSQSLESKDQLREKELQGLRAKSSQSLSRRDQRYQKEINDLRKMHTAQLERLMNDNSQKMEITKNSARGEIKQANLGKEDRTSELHTKYDEAIAAAEENYNKNIERMREEQRKSLDQVRSEQAKAHEQEMEVFRDYHAEKVGELKNDLRKTRYSTQQQLRNQEVRQAQDKMRINNQHMSDIQNREVAHNRQLDNYREDYEMAVDNVREKFSDDMQKKAEAQAKFQAQFNNDINDRLDSREQRLESQLQQQKAKAINAEIIADRKAEKEINNIRSTYQDKFDYLEQARRDTLNMANETNAQNVKKVRADADKIMVENNRRTMMNTDTEIMRQRQALDQARQDFEIRNEFQELATQGRVDQILNDSQTKEKRLRENFSSNVEVLKEGYQVESREQRLALEKEKSQTVKTLKEQLQRTEGENQQKLADLTSKYEKRISELNDQFVREKRLRDQREKQLVAELKRAHESQVEAVKAKYEEQNRQTVAKHDKELKDVTRRNKENIDNIMSISKKA